MNSFFIKSIGLQCNQNQEFKNKNTTFIARDRKNYNVSNHNEHILEPLVEIISGSQDWSGSESADTADFNYQKGHISSSESGSTKSGNERYIFVIMNNAAPATSSGAAKRIIDIKPALSGDDFPLGEVTVNNVTFSADKVRSTISEVIERLPDVHNLNLNSTEINHQFLLVLNCAIPFDVSDAPDGKPIRYPTTHNSIGKISRPTRPVSKRKLSRNALKQPKLVIDHDYFYKTRSRAAGPEALVEKSKEGLAKHHCFTDTNLKNSDEKEEEGDDCYVLVVDTNYDNTDGSGKENEENPLPEVSNEQPQECKLRGKDEQYVTCDKCKGVFKNKHNLRQHIINVCYKKENRREIVCFICGKVFHKTSSFKTHMASHENLRQFKCSKCDSRFNNNSFLLRHMKTVHGTLKYMYYCSHCPLKSESKEHIEMHEQTHTLPEGEEVPRPYQCDVCGKSYISKHALRIHKTTTGHGLQREARERWEARERRKARESCKETQLKCPLCDKTLSGVQTLNMHLEAKHGMASTKNREIRCDQCDRSYSRFGSYMRHKLVAHEADVTAAEVAAHLRATPEPRQKLKVASSAEVDPQVCQVCGKQCKNKKSLYVHNYYSHNQRRKARLAKAEPVSCNLCEKMFPHKLALASHKHRYHYYSASQLVCRVCNKQFKDYGALWGHEKYVHMDGVPFDCALCGSRFKRKGDYTRHLRDKHGVAKATEPIDDAEQEFEEFEAETTLDEIDPDNSDCSFQEMSYTQY